MNRSQIPLEMAQELGFDLVGVASLGSPRRGPELEAWLAAGRHGSMEYLERQRERILDPAQIAPGARSLLIVGLAHSRPAVVLEGGARVARYAAGRDYHNRMGKALVKLGRRLEAEGLAGPFRKIVDAGPLMERSHAAEAGLGAESKAGNLLAPTFGPWFFLGELLLGEELEPGEARPGLPDCGSCRACLDACPTGAIVAPGEVDARLCISYHTIENRGPIPRELRREIGPWVFGCDVCSEVCPWGREAPDRSESFGTHSTLESGAAGPGTSPLLGWLTSQRDFAEAFNGSPLQRPRREGLLRNAAIVLGNVPVDGGDRALAIALEGDPSALVRGAAAWALGQGYIEEVGTREALERAKGLEENPGVLAELDTALESTP